MWNCFRDSFPVNHFGVFLLFFVRNFLHAYSIAYCFLACQSFPACVCCMDDTLLLLQAKQSHDSMCLFRVCVVCVCVRYIFEGIRWNQNSLLLLPVRVSSSFTEDGEKVYCCFFFCLDEKWRIWFDVFIVWKWVLSRENLLCSIVEYFEFDESWWNGFCFKSYVWSIFSYFVFIFNFFRCLYTSILRFELFGWYTFNAIEIFNWDIANYLELIIKQI